MALTSPTGVGQYSIPKTMRSAVLFGPRDIRVLDRPVPQPGPGEVLVQVAMCGTCGTDLKIYDGHFPLTLPLGAFTLKTVMNSPPPSGLPGGTTRTSASDGPEARCHPAGWRMENPRDSSRYSVNVAGAGGRLQAARMRIGERRAARARITKSVFALGLP